MLGKKTTVLKFMANRRILRGSASTLFVNMRTPRDIDDFEDLPNAP